MTTWTLAIDGMTCEGCSSRVEEGLTELDGVREAEADHEAGRARVRVAEDGEVADAFGTALDGLGFELVDADET